MNIQTITNLQYAETIKIYGIEEYGDKVPAETYDNILLCEFKY
jgi:hypothetical protein